MDTTWITHHNSDEISKIVGCKAYDLQISNELRYLDPWAKGFSLHDFTMEIVNVIQEIAVVSGVEVSSLLEKIKAQVDQAVKDRPIDYFERELIACVRRSVQYGSFSNEDRDSFARLTIKDLVLDFCESQERRRNRCMTCKHGQHDNCLGFECPHS